MTIRLFTIVFGEQYLNWFERGLMRSLTWPKNYAALRQITVYDVWTTKEYESRARGIAARLNLPIEIHYIASLERKMGLASCLITQMELCRNNAFIWAAPDNVFGDGTIGNIMEIGRVPGVCVAWMPLRVNETSFTDPLTDSPLSNAQLARLGFSRAHRGFTDACATAPQNNSYESGVSWRKLDNSTYAVTCRMPSSYFMQPIASDIKWFADRQKFGNYDHAFPQLLIEAQRQRVIGSSDAAFTVEITPEHIANAPLTKTNPNEPDKFIKVEPHYGVNRNTLCIWRAADE